jgi:hypothetical protein
VTDSPFVLAGIVIIILAIVGGIATTIVRSRAYEPNDEPADLSKLDALMATPPVEEPERLEDDPLPDLWARLVATEDGPLDVRDRLDMVGRLEMVGEKWCIDALESATHEERDPQVNAAVRATLTRLSA